MIPHDPKRKTFSLKLPSKLVHSLLLIVVFAAGLLVGTIGYNILLTNQARNYQFALSLTSNKAQKIDYFEKETGNLKAAVLDLHLRNNQLRELLGLKLEKPSANVKKVVDQKLLNKVENKEKSVSEMLEETKKITKKDTEELVKIKAHVTDVFKKTAAIPSKWPIYGKIVSKFGYRVFPWPGMHTGTDIQAKFGDIFRATAPGVVTYTGWRSGYGLTIELKHQYGYSTLFAHCSQVLVSQGEKIKSGQVLGRVGMTGYSTGPHLHYEIKKDGVAINPSVFLGLNPLAAARILK